MKRDSRATVDWYLATVEKQTGTDICLRKIRGLVSTEREREHSCIPGAAGSAEQRGAAFGDARGLGTAALHQKRSRIRSGRSWKRFRRGCSKDGGSGWSPCANARSCWEAAWNSGSPPAGGTLVRLTGTAGRKRNCMPNKISVLLVDDHALVRRGFRRILEDEADISVVGEAGDGAEAVRLGQTTSSLRWW